MNSLRRAALAGFALSLPAAASAQTILAFTPSTAAAGSSVVITGLGFGSLKSVQLNGQAMRVTSSNATSVTVVVPPAAATGKLRLTTNSGTVLSGSKLGITRQSSAVSYGQITTAFTSANASGSFSTPTTGDLDGDGLVELIVGQGDGTIMWYEQTAANSTTLGTGQLLQTAAGVTIDVGNYAKPTVADLDGNGLLEIVVGEETGNVLRYEQAGSNGANALKFNLTTLFTNPFGTATASAPNGGSYARPSVSDLDNNGLLDILVGANDGTLRRYEQLAANNATTAGFKAWGLMKMADGTNIDAGSVDKPLVTDYDGDGYLDMLLGNQAGNIMLYTQSARNAVTFTTVGNLTTDGTSAKVINMGNSGTNAYGKSGYAAPAITDIDGDGLLDLFVGNGSGSVYRFEQTQSSTVPTLIGGALPVTLSSFTGQAATAGAALRWTTASEKNSAAFVVERSADGQTFTAVAELPAAGNSNAPLTYTYTDASAAARNATTNYYRLRQVDNDGTIAYSPVITLKNSASAALGTATVYPNPFAETLNVALPASTDQPATVALTTLTGKVVYAGQLQANSAAQALPTAELPAGIYVLRISTAAGTTSQKVVRQ